MAKSPAQCALNKSAMLSLLCGWGVRYKSPCTSWDPCQRRSSNRLKTTISCTKNLFLKKMADSPSDMILRHRIWATKDKKKKKSRECQTLRRDQELKGKLQGSVMSKKSFSGGGPPRYQLQVVSERRMQAYCRACSPFRLLSNSQSVHKHSLSPVEAHGTL